MFIEGCSSQGFVRQEVNKMFFNKETDYAIRIVAQLAENRLVTDAKKIALQTGVTERFTLKILHKLVVKGVVKSYKGACGGYILAREPGGITLLDIIEDINGKLEFNDCQDSGSCTHPRGLCRFYSVFDKASHDLRETFGSVTFEIKDR